VKKVSTTAAPKAPMKPKTAPSAPAKSPPRKAAPRNVNAKAPLSKALAATGVQKTAQPPKSKKTKLVRDSFTIPKPEYVVLDELKQRAAKLTRPAKKSELLRAGIKILAALSDAAFLTALAQVPAIKTGRPALGK
ncbi:MAG: hypothetical protein ACYCZL_01400, partial [Polaromonas sp.]